MWSWNSDFCINFSLRVAAWTWVDGVKLSESGVHAPRVFCGGAFLLHSHTLWVRGCVQSFRPHPGGARRLLPVGSILYSSSTRWELVCHPPSALVTGSVWSLMHKQEDSNLNIHCLQNSTRNTALVDNTSEAPATDGSFQLRVYIHAGNITNAQFPQCNTLK